MSKEDSYICICGTYKILFAALLENSLWGVTNCVSYRTQRCSDGKLQAGKGRLFAGGRWRRQPAAVHPLQLHQAFEGHLSQGLLVAEGGDQISLSEQGHGDLPQSGRHNRAVCSLLLNSPALLVAPWPAFEPLTNSSICLPLNPPRDGTQETFHLSALFTTCWSKCKTDVSLTGADSSILQWHIHRLLGISY